MSIANLSRKFVEKKFVEKNLSTSTNFNKKVDSMRFISTKFMKFFDSTDLISLSLYSIYLNFIVNSTWNSTSNHCDSGWKFQVESQRFQVGNSKMNSKLNHNDSKLIPTWINNEIQINRKQTWRNKVCWIEKFYKFVEINLIESTFLIKFVDVDKFFIDNF
jgi:hypothetical protein